MQSLLNISGTQQLRGGGGRGGKKPLSFLVALQKQTQTHAHTDANGQLKENLHLVHRTAEWIICTKAFFFCKAFLFIYLFLLSFMNTALRPLSIHLSPSECWQRHESCSLRATSALNKSRSWDTTGESWGLLGQSLELGTVLSFHSRGQPTALSAAGSAPQSSGKGHILLWKKGSLHGANRWSKTKGSVLIIRTEAAISRIKMCTCDLHHVVVLAQ